MFIWQRLMTKITSETPTASYVGNVGGAQLKFRFGKRKKHAGGRSARDRHAIRHGKRIRVVSRQPIHIVSRALPRAGCLRDSLVFAAIRRATRVVANHAQFRIVHASIQESHLHMIVEATSGEALTTGMHSFLVSAARGINRAHHAHGRVFERYHATTLTTPSQVRNCIAYVLNNWRHHQVDACQPWLIDKYSSAVGFDGWRELHGARFAIPVGYEPLVTHEPTQWLLRAGWRRYGLVSIYEVPG
jgi:putative transposase